MTDPPASVPTKRPRPGVAASTADADEDCGPEARGQDMAQSGRMAAPRSFSPVRRIFVSSACRIRLALVNRRGRPPAASSIPLANTAGSIRLPGPRSRCSRTLRKLLEGIAPEKIGNLPQGCRDPCNTVGSCPPRSRIGPTSTRRSSPPDSAPGAPAASSPALTTS